MTVFNPFPQVRHESEMWRLKAEELRLKLEEWENHRSGGVLAMSYSMADAAEQGKMEYKPEGFFMEHDFDRKGW